MMPCYSRRNAIIPEKEFTSVNMNINDFYIYPENQSTWMVFKYYQLSDSFMLYDWFDINEFYLINPELLTRLPPLRISDNKKYELAIASLSNQEKLVLT